MLGKTAGGLFWMFRYLERTENTARLIEAGPAHRADPVAAAPTTNGASVLTDRRASTTPICAQHDDARHGARSIDFLLRDHSQPVQRAARSSTPPAAMPAWCARR